MNDDPASLDRLHDIVAPGPVPWWPPAPGVYLALSLVCACLLALAGRALWRHLRRAYRREALAAMSRATPTVVDLATLLKRVALTAYPRAQVAGVTGRAWLLWLARTGGCAVPPAVADLLTAAVYKDDGARDTAALTSFARQWIRRHHARPPPTPEPRTPHP
ncbi:MAG: DUF4381 domain-containing protein [Lentisphaerae bacterium]|nr:DUF4381 domain-containing protein [Lentisphaerota bacterium]